MIYVFSSKNVALLGKAFGPDKKQAWFKLMPEIPKAFVFQPGDQAYLDISGFSPAELKKTLGVLKKSNAFWGIVDPKGEAEDPASFFFEGSGDYIGPALVKKGLGKKRFDAALSWSDKNKSAGTKGTEPAGKEKSQKQSQKPLEEKFEGWKLIRAGTTGSFFFMFVSLSAKSNLRSMVGEKSFIAIKDRLRDILQHGFLEADALLWMENEANSLFLIPPKTANARAAIEGALKMILNSRIITAEKLGLLIPAELTFAFHYGQTIFQAPGKTGAVISEPVNYIFHLGTKKAEAGRLTVSADVPDESFPSGLKDLFTGAGVFEGINISHSKRFLFE